MSNFERPPMQQPYNRPPGGPAPYSDPHQGGPAPYSDPYQGGPAPYSDYPPSSHAPRRERPRDGSGSRRTALVISTIADIAAVFLGLWILLYLLDANQANAFVGFVQGMADWLSWWARDIFTMDSEGMRMFLNYGLPAGIYLLVGHGISAWVRRL